MKKITASLTALAVCLALIFSLIHVNASNRDDAPSDAAYANFRNVKSGTIGKNNLYRSVHPASSSKRAAYANQLAKDNGVRTVLNLADNRVDLEKRFISNNIGLSYYYRSLYKKGQVYSVRISTSGYNNSHSRRQFVTGLKFFAKNKGPYLVHCEIGRDRTGFVIMLLECLMEAPYSYMLEDFTKSDINLYQNSYSESKKKAVKRLKRDLSYLTGKSKETDWSKIRLSAYAEKYLKAGGMSAAEISALSKNLSISYR
ncbi:MAG: tyrosine-protein phosphatase, partial [Eubacteriales bacterium]|nr:tyrosine-protein phosphatase [Eubacteriales bacterium]